MKKVKYYKVFANGIVTGWFSFGVFHGWGVCEGNSCAIIEVDHHERMNGNGERNDTVKGNVELVTLNNHVLKFVE